MKYLLICAFILFGSSCIKDYYSVAQSIIKNSTNHQIKILPYKDGIPLNDQLVLIGPNANDSIIKHSTIKGKSLGQPYGTYLMPYDSVLIWFDDVKYSKHLRFGDSTVCDRCIDINSSRAISNPNNWVKAIQEETKHGLRGSFTYTFTEQDYLDAK
jgi:hypothetical protein